MRGICLSSDTSRYLLTEIDINMDTQKCEEFKGLALNPTSETIGITNFSNEVGECGAVKANAPRFSVLEGTDVQSVKDYLARPRLINSGSFPASLGVITSASFNTSTSLRTLFTATQWDRLKGAVGFRGTLRFTLVSAATPFHQGLAYMCYQYGANSTTEPNSCRGLQAALAPNLPHVRLNVAEQSMAILDVPYVSHREYIPIDIIYDTPNIDYGVFVLGMLLGSPVVAGQTAAQYSLYLSLHDIELIGAVPYVTSSILLQTGVERTVHASQSSSSVTKEAKAGGIVSGTLESLANVASVVGMVPGLDKLGGTADWMLRAMSKSASAFGFSKPNDETAWTKMVRYAYAGESQVDVPNEAFPLAPFMSNKLAVSSAIGCIDEDQLAFPNVLTKPSYIFRGNFTDSSIAGDLLYGGWVSPCCFWYRDYSANSTGNVTLPTSASITQNAFIPSTLCYVGDNFRYWRGAIRYKITFAKTKLHGGRVQFTYIPYTSDVSASTVLPNIIRIPEVSSGLVQPSGYSEVFDLKDGSEIDFVVPYVALEPYMSYYSAVGSVSMIVVNPLRVTGNAPTTVQFMVEVSAEPDFEFAVVKPSLMAGVAKTGTTAIKFQTGIDPPEDVNQIKTTDDASQHVIGERFQSLKQLMMIPDWYTFDVANATINRFVPIPWFKINSIPLTTPIVSTAQALYYASRSSRVAALFAFVNGGTAYSLHQDGGNSTGVTITGRFKGNDAGYTSPTFSDLYAVDNNSYSSVYIPEEQSSARFIIPTYSKFMRIPSARTTGPFGADTVQLTDATAYTNQYTDVQPEITIRNNSGASRRVTVGRAAADDALASQFIGPPICTLFPSTSSVSPVSGAQAGIAQF